MTDLHPELERRWHVLAVETGSESAVSVDCGLLRGVTAWVPTFVTEKQKGRTRATIQEQEIALPGYVFICVPLALHWPAILEMDCVWEPVPNAGTDSYHIIPEPQIEVLKQAEANNFGEPVHMTDEAKIEIGQTIMATIGLIKVKGKVTVVGKKKVRARMENMDQFGDVEIPIAELLSA